MAAAPVLREERRHFGGATRFYSHVSDVCAGEMRFSVFHPPQAEQGPVPVLTYLSGLTCTEENFTIKAGAQRVAAELGLMIVAPDTSPRETGIAGEDEAWDFGSGAGFYCDATQNPWSAHYQMYSYVTQELPALITEHFPADDDRQGIFGHSMGGHGALVAAMRNPDLYRSCSAFAPISPWRWPTSGPRTRARSSRSGTATGPTSSSGWPGNGISSAPSPSSSWSTRRPFSLRPTPTASAPYTLITTPSPPTRR